MIRIAIDLNVRVEGGHTVAGFARVEGDPSVLAVHDEVTVFERETGVEGSGRIVKVDTGRQLVFIDVEWKTLGVPSGTMGARL